MFTFLNTILLSALALSLIPVLIHLLNRKKSRLVIFSTLDFLKSLQKRKMKRVRFRQILLLIMRTVILLMAALAFARPVMKSNEQSAIGMHARTSVVVIVDNGVGTSYVSEKGMVLDEIKLKAEQIIGFLHEGDEVAVIPAANGTSLQPVDFSRNMTEARAQIDALKFRNNRSYMNEALFAAYKALDDAQNANKEIYVISPLQASVFTEDRINARSDVKLVFIDVLPPVINNVAIKDFRVLSKIIEVNKPADVRAVIKNNSKSDIRDLLLNVYLDGKRVAQTAVTMGGEDEAVVDLKITPTRTGFLKGLVEIDDDPFAADNKKFFHLFVPAHIKALLAGNDAQSLEFIRLALNPTDNTTNAVQTRAVDAKQLSQENLTAYDVVLLADLGRLDEALVRKIRSFLRSGKGLLLIPGDHWDINNYNTFLPSLGFGKITGLSDQTASAGAVKFGRMDFSHPVIRGMFDQPMSQEKLIESPEFVKFFKTDRTAPSRSIVTYSDNSSFMEEASGAHRIIFFTSSADLEWSNWPIKGIFVTLIHRSVYYLYSRNFEAPAYEIGDRVEMSLSGLSGNDLKLEDPDGVELLPRLKQEGEDVLLTLSTLEKPGNYSILSGSSVTNMFYANIRPDQSDFSRISEAKLESLVVGGEVEMADSRADLQNIILESRYGTELWKWLILGVFVLMIAEIFVAQGHRISKN